MILNPPQLTFHIGPCTALATAFKNCVLECEQSTPNSLAVGLEAKTLTFVEPGRRAVVATCAIAVAACCHFVFYPAGPTFDTGYHVFGGGTVEAHLNRGAAPNAFVAVTLQNEGHALAAVQLAFMVAQGARFARHKKQIKGRCGF
jgi:hypothetical protein